MALFTKLRTAVVVMAIATVAYADSHAGMSMDDKSKDADERLATLRKGLQLKFVHWFISVAFLVVTPAFGACYALADRFRPAVGIQAVAGVYSIVEALVLRFPDPQGHENRTSRGTAWFLMLFYALVVVNGAVCEGASMAAKLRDSRIGRIASRLSPMSYKVMSVLLCECGFLKAGMNIIAMLGFCYNDHTGQCNAHGIMGMSFIAYGLFLATMVVIPWLRVNRHRYSQEMYDSAMITAWGIVNTFTEHRPWQPWSHHDYQHTSMGIIFWACGMLGMFLSRHHKRNFMPALTLIFTGYAMGQHSQHTVTSEKLHSFFGLVLMFGGASRIAEISFLLGDADSDPSGRILSFQYMPPLALVSAGILFMCANEEQVQLVIDMGADHAAYILIALSASCLVLLFFIAMLEFYLHLRGYSPESNQPYNTLGDGDDLESQESRDIQSGDPRDTEFQLDDLSSLDEH
ncbi:YTP1 [Brettanomyces bruxellensis]|uniref:DEBR0S2_12904g1_1 n=1 Tax=Dekkera bruxellensis TaxID=5007 RepID=A0A7D9CXK1_DEKBR|nr:YTP1 [Brettanomyces bruxellensis]